MNLDDETAGEGLNRGEERKRGRKEGRRKERWKNHYLLDGGDCGTGSIFGRGLESEGLRKGHQSFIHGTEFEVMNESCERYDVAPPAF